MAQHMHGIILEATKFVIGVARYLSLTYDEVSSIDNQSWLSVHAYVVWIGWEYQFSCPLSVWWLD